MPRAQPWLTIYKQSTGEGRVFLPRLWKDVKISSLCEGQLKSGVIFTKIPVMICDAVANINDYKVLSSGLEFWQDLSWTRAEEMKTYQENEKLCTLFFQSEGESFIATSWRENNSSLDVLGAIRLKEGQFALFLPGERFICRPGGECRVYCLE